MRLRAAPLIASAAFVGSAAAILASAILSTTLRGAPFDATATLGPALGLAIAAAGCALLRRSWGRYVVGVGLLLHLLVPFPSLRGEWTLLTGANSSFAALGGGTLLRQAGEAVALLVLLARVPRWNAARAGATLGALGAALAGGAVAWLWLDAGIAGRFTGLVVAADALQVAGFVGLAFARVAPTGVSGANARSAH